MAAEAQQAPEQVFETVDVDKDGLISQEELSQLIKHLNMTISDEDVTKFFAEADKDQDGKINFEEFKQLLAVEA